MTQITSFATITSVYNAGSKPTPHEIQLYIESKPDFEQRCAGDSPWHKSTGMTLLHIAALNGDTSTIHLLADSGADINALDISGQTPLHYAIDFDFVVATQDDNMPTELPTVLAVLQHNADDTIRNSDGETAIDTLADFAEIPPLYQDTVNLAAATRRAPRNRG